MLVEEKMLKLLSLHPLTEVTGITYFNQDHPEAWLGQGIVQAHAVLVGQLGWALVER